MKEEKNISKGRSECVSVFKSDEAERSHEFTRIMAELINRLEFERCDTRERFE